jgi:hypothetical protein
LEKTGFWWDDREQPPGTFPYERILNPVTGQPVIDPLEILALIDGCAYVHPRTGHIHIDFYKLLDSRRAFRQIPKYVGLTPQEIETFQKLREDVMVDHFFLAEVLNITRPRALRVLADARIPVYLLGQQRMFFCGDLARWLEARRIDLLANGELEVRAYAKAKIGEAWRRGDVQAASSAGKIARGSPHLKGRRGKKPGGSALRPLERDYGIDGESGSGRKRGRPRKSDRWPGADAYDSPREERPANRDQPEGPEDYVALGDTTDGSGPGDAA